MRKKLKVMFANIIAIGTVLILSPTAFATTCGNQETYFDWSCKTQSGNTGDNGIMQIAWAVFYIVSGLVAAGCLGAIVYGAIRYSASNSNASAAKEGLDTIRNAVIALVLYGTFFAILSLLTNGAVTPGAGP
jgi:hypothetical protein